MPVALKWLTNNYGIAPVELNESDFPQGTTLIDYIIRFRRDIRHLQPGVEPSSLDADQGHVCNMQGELATDCVEVSAIFVCSACFGNGLETAEAKSARRHVL